MTDRFDVAIVGGGVVGSALAYGMRALGRRLAIVDTAVATSPSRNNFGLVWVQGKGVGCADYVRWTLRSAQARPRLAAELAAITGIDVALEQRGGLHVCLSPREVEARRRRLAQLVAQAGAAPYDVEWLDRTALADRLPGIGPDVAGATFCALDGHCNPARLLEALHAAIDAAGVSRFERRAVLAIDAAGHGFALRTSERTLVADRLVLAAGLDNARLAPMVGLVAPLRPVKGQVLVLERPREPLPLPLETLRQTGDGNVLVGDSHQESGDDTVEPAVLAAMARRALRLLPALAEAKASHAWAACRVMSPDGFPVIGASPSHPGAFVVACHSGVTLAAVHAYELAPALIDGALPGFLAAFSPARFAARRAADVPTDGARMRRGTVALPLGGLTLGDVARWPTTPDAERAVARERW